MTILNSKQWLALTENSRPDGYATRKVDTVAKSQSVTQSSAQIPLHEFTHLVIQNSIYSHLFHSVNTSFISSARNTFMHLFFHMHSNGKWRKWQSQWRRFAYYLANVNLFRGIVTEVREVLKSMNIYNLTSSCDM